MNDKPDQRVTKQDFIRLPLTSDGMDEEYQRAIVIYNQRKMRDDEVPIELIYHGNLAERVIGKQYHLPRADTKDYDFIFPNGTTVDSKTKLVRQDNPYPNHYNEIRANKITQKTDFYIFSQVCLKHQSVWLLGYISKEEFLKYSDFVKDGHVKPNDWFQFTANGDCYCLQAMYLKPMKNFLEEINEVGHRHAQG
jgi:hypothetical protein